MYKPTQATGTISDAELADAVFENRVNGLPINDNGIYMIMFYGSLTLDGWADGSPYGYCGYHTIYSADGLDAKVGIVGDPATAVPWNLGCLPWGDTTPNKDFSADNFMSVYTHEVVEVATDAFGM